MNKNKDKNENEIPPTHYKFYLGSRERYIHICSDFEAGNIRLVRQMSQFNYRLSCIDDGVKTEHRVNSKSWFYFRVFGFPKNTKGKFTVSRVQTLMAVYTHHPKSYRPVFRDRPTSTSLWSQWSRIPSQSPLIMRQNGELEVTFEFLFKNQFHEAEFAFAFPYSYTRNSEYLNSLNEYYCNQEFYFHKEVLTTSPEKRNIHLLTITSHDQVSSDPEHEQIFNERLFPEKCRPKKFKKPVILISARVHPGQTAASFTMEGVINFLINNKDVRSYLLKKMFVFMIVPMINVDGVYHGHFRMDGFGKNLNRYYLDPSLQKQPAIYAIKELASHLVKSNRLSFYFDLHAHNAKKGAFIYGNAINDFVEQVESQVFCKLFALNHSGFEYDYCNFSQKQMNSKDRNQERTKEGCGRVVMHRLANIVHSYSLQCGIISALKPNTVPEPMNRQFQLSQKSLYQTPQKQVNHEGPYFTQESYRELGKAMLVSVLDVFDKNPYNRVYNSQHKSLQLLRRVTAFEVFHHAQRFRMFEKYVYGKVKNINELIREVLNSKLHYRQLYNFYFYNDNELKNTEWPENIPGLVKPKFTKKLKRFKSLQEPRLEYSLSFMQDLKTNKDQLDQGISSTINTNSSRQAKLLSSLGQLKEIVFEKEGEENEDGSGSSETENDDEVEGKRSDEETFYENMMEEDKEVHSESFIPYGMQTLVKNEPEEQISRWSTYNQRGSQPWFTEKQLCLSEKDIMEEDGEEETEDNQINFYNIEEVKKLTRLKFFSKPEEQIKLTHNDSPSMRVRKMMKNEGSKKVQLTNKEMKGKLTQMIANSPQICHNSFAAGQTLTNYSGLSSKSQKQGSEVPFHERKLKLFDEIKHEIKEELKRHKDRHVIASGRSKIQKYSISEMKQKERVRSTNPGFGGRTITSQHNNHFHQKQKSETLNRQPSRSLVGKTQLPALNSHILIISSNSSKGLNHT